jgi:hypothetical protein
MVLLFLAMPKTSSAQNCDVVAQPSEITISYFHWSKEMDARLPGERRNSSDFSAPVLIGDLPRRQSSRFETR